ncbi:CD209 antigen-like protein E [Gadus chalcogrammus]|uniref:CD209 antigen-like protein E n=1 Tax=Gadus chalcogrammus TaxID=1042646 RepID=UPI0024C271BA|nr:CD209 antigen-like protein E [Gadus chalcogrammus]
MSQRSGDIEMHVETSAYQSYSGNQTQVFGPDYTANSKRHLHLAFLNLGLLCILQALLNITLRVHLNGPRDSPETAFPNLTCESGGWGFNKDRPTWCHTSWQMFSSGSYYVSRVRGSWNTGRTDCLERGAQLVIVNDKEELAIVTRLARDPTAAWIGMTDLRKEGSWRWLDGTLVTLDRPYWAPGQPDNAGGEDCGEIHTLANFSGFNDYDCSIRLRWICEKIPTPPEFRVLERNGA